MPHWQIRKLKPDNWPEAGVGCLLQLAQAVYSQREHALYLSLSPILLYNSHSLPICTSDMHVDEMMDFYVSGCFTSGKMLRITTPSNGKLKILCASSHAE